MSFPTAAESAAAAGAAAARAASSASTASGLAVKISVSEAAATTKAEAAAASKVAAASSASAAAASASAASASADAAASSAASVTDLATATPTADKIPIAGPGGKLAAGWLPNVSAFASIMSDELDLTAVTETSTWDQAFPGYYFIVTAIRFIVTQLDGTITTPSTMQLGNNVAFDNVMTSGQQLSASFITTILAAGLPGVCVNFLGLHQSVGTQLIDLSTPFKWKNTVGAVLGTATEFKARVALTGSLIAV